jgi:hypothetical protein
MVRCGLDLCAASFRVMTIITQQLAYMERPSGEFILEVDWDDTLATLDPDDGEKHMDTGELILYRIINTTSLVGMLQMRRNKTVDWINQSVPIGTFVFAPSGPVNETQDIQAWALWMGS